jgi:hypothetical protein
VSNGSEFIPDIGTEGLITASWPAIPSYFAEGSKHFVSCTLDVGKLISFHISEASPPIADV